MSPPGFGETSDQHFFGGIEKEDIDPMAGTSDVVKNLGEYFEVVAIANIDYNGEFVVTGFPFMKTQKLFQEN
jgi:hypothetical protein